jgi:tight adherence protein C
VSAAMALGGIAAVAACLAAWESGTRSRAFVSRAWQILASAGFIRSLVSPRDALALKCVCAVLAGLVGVALASFIPGRMPLLLITTAPVAGFLAPDRWLARLTRRRLDAAVRELPDMLDLFRVTVEAGMPATRALGVVASEFDGPLAREWRRVALEMTLGVPQEEALAGLAGRLPADEIRSFVEALDRSRRRGVPIGRAAAAQATVARHHQRRRVREQAARAGPKIQLVVALLLVPSVLLLVAAGLVAELGRSPLGAFPS